MPNLSSILSLDDDASKQVAENDVIVASDISTANKISTANNVTSANDISTVNHVTTANNIASANDISTTNNVASANDISTVNHVTTANNVASANDISTVNYVTTANNVASANDITIKKNVQELNFAFNVESGKVPKKLDCRPNIVDKRHIVGNTKNKSYKLKRKILLPEVKPQVNVDVHNKYLFQVASSVAKNSSLFIRFYYVT